MDNNLVYNIQYLLEPIEVSEAKFKALTLKRQFTLIDILQAMRKRIGFFAIYNLFDKVECNELELQTVNHIQRRHALRL